MTGNTELNKYKDRNKIILTRTKQAKSVPKTPKMVFTISASFKKGATVLSIDRTVI